jgi:uncharacterized membrane protein YfcA
MRKSPQGKSLRALAPFLVWLTAFYAVWLFLIFPGGFAGTALENWPMAVAMLFGSFVAGSTPMGGGTVGFPILVMLFGEPPLLGRDFSFAVQSIGMTSASIFIVCRRVPVDWKSLRGSFLGSALGLPIGLAVLAPLVPQRVFKLIFAVAWGAFGAFVLFRCRLLADQSGLSAPVKGRFTAGFWVGLLCGLTMTAMTGVGVDMALFMVLMLAFGSDLKTAIPTSVLVMAYNSILGISLLGSLSLVQEGVWEAWLAAAPVVIFGAPLGAFTLSRIGRLPAMIFVALLCVGQFIWAISQEAPALGAPGLALVVAAFGAAAAGFELARRRFSRPAS